MIGMIIRTLIVWYMVFAVSYIGVLALSGMVDLFAKDENVVDCAKLIASMYAMYYFLEKEV